MRVSGVIYEAGAETMSQLMFSIVFSSVKSFPTLFKQEVGIRPQDIAKGVKIICHSHNVILPTGSSVREKKIVSVCKLSVIKYHNQKINIRHSRPSPVIPGLIRESAKSCLCVKLLTNMSEHRRALKFKMCLINFIWKYRLYYKCE